MLKPIALAADHGGFVLKNNIRQHLEQQGFAVLDFGTDTADSCDYADFAFPACKAVLDGRCEYALLFCSTGVGMSITANKLHGIRACCCSDAYTAALTRRHNNANVLCLGGRVVGDGLAQMIVDNFLASSFEGGRHQQRIDKIAAIEEREGR